jgi:DNA mismatch repair protein MutS2
MMPEVPEKIEQVAAGALEWERLRGLVAGHAQSPAGREWMQALTPSRNALWIRQEQALVEEARGLVRADVGFSFAGLDNPSEMLGRARAEGTMLEGEDLLRAAGLAAQAAGWGELLRMPPAAVEGGIPVLRERGVRLMDGGVRAKLRELAEAVNSKLEPDGTVAEDASPELRRLRREQEKQRKLIEDGLRSTLRKLSSEGAAQDELITVRGERFVIPVKVEQKRRVTGVVHGASSSGQTIFVEPLETIEQNNELVRLRDEAAEEARKVLQELTRRVGESAGDLGVAAVVLAEADSAMGRARFGESYGCVRAEVWDGGTEELSEVERDGEARRGLTLEVVEARHPLLEQRLRRDGKAIVPVTVTFAAETRQIVISGPNAGGKSVALKTVGLLSLMAQAGFPVPAARARLPVFTAVLADIGDAQSIENDLSTFSAHVTNLAKIARVVRGLTVGERALVLLDEAGTATDPEEGAAIAVAVAEFLLEPQVWSIISTHYGALKAYAAGNSTVENAAVGFDDNTLAPSYKLRAGVPGASAGINVAERLGLDSGIVKRARERLGVQGEELARFLERLHRELDAAVEERARLQKAEQEVAREKNRLAHEGKNEQRQKIRELERKLEELLKDFAYRAQESVKAVEDRAAQTKVSREADRRVAKARREFKEEFNQAVVGHTTGADTGDENATPHLVKHVAVGDRVKLRSLGGKMGQVTRLVDEDTFEVQAGPMKMRVKRADIAEVARESEGRNPLESARGRGIRVEVGSETAASEVNVIGQNAEEAERIVERFLDRAFLSGVPQVRIVHGTGMGVLRRTLRQYLKTHPQVGAVREAAQSEGGAGATVVEMKD